MNEVRLWAVGWKDVTGREWVEVFDVHSQGINRVAELKRMGLSHVHLWDMFNG